MNDVAGTDLSRRLSDLISFFGVNAEVQQTENEDEVILTVASDATGRLIGHHGETLTAIQHIISMIAKRGGERRRISVDIGGYKQAREYYLQQSAQKAADRVVQTGAEEELRPMNPAERRIVHKALTERDDVETESRGEDPKRWIVIKPKADA